VKTNPTIAEVATAGARHEDIGDGWLGRAAVLFAVAVIIHNSDHLRRGVDKLTTDVFWAGTTGMLLEVAVVVLICQRHRLAPLAAAAGGSFLAASYLEVHFLPAHRWLSDSFTGASNVSPLSWTAASMEVAGALVLAVVGLRVLRRRGGIESASRPHPQQRRLAKGVIQPVALVLILTQVAGLAVSFLQAYG
jgi:hypothetical protein